MFIYRQKSIKFKYGFLLTSALHVQEFMKH